MMRNNNGSSAAKPQAGLPAHGGGTEDGDETHQQRRKLQQASPARKRHRRRLPVSENSTIVDIDRTRYSISPATGLHGLAESSFLSSFLEHYTGM